MDLLFDFIQERMMQKTQQPVLRKHTQQAFLSFVSLFCPPPERREINQACVLGWVGAMLICRKYMMRTSCTYYDYYTVLYYTILRYDTIRYERRRRFCSLLFYALGFCSMILLLWRTPKDGINPSRKQKQLFSSDPNKPNDVIPSIFLD